jgi:2-pyrone-4,6-dicarboxylate lactonase
MRAADPARNDVRPEPLAGSVTRPPPDAWDCHAHVIGDPQRFPLAPRRGYDPPHAPLEGYLAFLDRLGIARGVLVQPSVYGFDNRCMLDALERADGRLIGVAVPAPDTSERELERLHACGVRGVRCNLLNPGGLEIDAALRWTPALRALGWHVGLQIAVGTRMHGGSDSGRREDLEVRSEAPESGALRALVERFDVPVVIDHMGRPAPGRADPRASALRELIDLVGEGLCFVKLSAPYRMSAEPPPWRDATTLARALLDANPDACLWGSDWPHTESAERISPDDLIEALREWCPDARTEAALLARNPPPS